MGSAEQLHLTNLFMRLPFFKLSLPLFLHLPYFHLPSFSSVSVLPLSFLSSLPSYDSSLSLSFDLLPLNLFYLLTEQV